MKPRTIFGPEFLTREGYRFPRWMAVVIGNVYYACVPHWPE